MEGTVAVARFGTHIEADLAKSALDAAGIQAIVLADDVGGQRPHLAFSQGVVVLVHVDDETAAREILAGASEDQD